MSGDKAAPQLGITFGTCRYSKQRHLYEGHYCADFVAEDVPVAGPAPAAPTWTEGEAPHVYLDRELRDANGAKWAPVAMEAQGERCSRCERGDPKKLCKNGIVDAKPRMWHYDDLGITGLCTAPATAAPSEEPRKSFADLAVDIARECYDRFVMGGWQASDAHEMIQGMLCEALLEHRLANAGHPSQEGPNFPANSIPQYVGASEPRTAAANRIPTGGDTAEQEQNKAASATMYGTPPLRNEPVGSEVGGAERAFTIVIIM